MGELNCLLWVAPYTFYQPKRDWKLLGLALLASFFVKVVFKQFDIDIVDNKHIVIDNLLIS